MVKRRIASGASWVGEKLLTVVVLAGLLMVFGIPVVIFTQMGLSESWSYMVMAGFLVTMTGIIVACILWGVKKADRIRRGID
jgi:hypothetical protein